jgi:hypothetical protein
MSECSHEFYKGYQITAAARLTPVAGDCWQLQPVYRPLAMIAWHSGGKSCEKRFDDPKHVFPDPNDALRVALGMAKRYIDQLDSSHPTPPDHDAGKRTTLGEPPCSRLDPEHD